MVEVKDTPENQKALKLMIAGLALIGLGVLLVIVSLVLLIFFFGDDGLTRVFMFLVPPLAIMLIPIGSLCMASAARRRQLSIGELLDAETARVAPSSVEQRQRFSQDELKARAEEVQAEWDALDDEEKARRLSGN